jgi:hypothetical protein
MNSFEDHGHVGESLLADGGDSEATLAEVTAASIDTAEVTVKF